MNTIPEFLAALVATDEEIKQNQEKLWRDVEFNDGGRGFSEKFLDPLVEKCLQAVVTVCEDEKLGLFAASWKEAGEPKVYALECRLAQKARGTWEADGLKPYQKEQSQEAMVFEAAASAVSAVRARLFDEQFDSGQGTWTTKCSIFGCMEAAAAYLKKSGVVG